MQRWRWGLAIAAGLLAAVLAAWQVAAQVLKQRVVAALGEQAEVGSLRIGWGGVVIDKLRLPAPEGWPTKDTLRAERVLIEPDLGSLFAERYSIRRITAEGAYLSVLRNEQSQLRVLPTLLDRQRRKDPEKRAPELSIGSVELRDSVLDFHDRSVKGRQVVSLHFEPVRARLDDLRIPEFRGKSPLHAEGTVRGPRHQGTVKVEGWVEIGTRASDLKTIARGVDLLEIEPYLLRATEDGVESGTLDLDLHSKVENRHLDAKGKLRLNDLHLRPGGGIAGTFLGVPRRAVIASMKSGSDDLELDFTMRGNLGDTKFSLNETLSVRVAVGLAQSLGVGLVDVIKGVGDLGGSGLKSVGDAIGGLFGSDDDAEPENAPETKR
jgi:hypothetical protein